MAWLPYFAAYLLLLVAPLKAQESGWQLNQVNATMCQWQEPRAAIIKDALYVDGGYLKWTPGMSDGSYGQVTQDGNPYGLVYILNFSTPFSTSQNFSQVFTTIAKASGGAANNIGPQYYDGTMFANDGEFFLYGGLLSNTAAFAPPPANSVKGYQAYWYGASGKKFTPGFIDIVLPVGTTRYVTAGGGVSVLSENMGYYFSGLRSKTSDSIFYTSLNTTLNADVISNTLISVNMTNQQGEVWRNQTLPTTVPGRANPELVWVPVSKKGILVAIGGVVDPVFSTIRNSLNASQIAESQLLSPKFMSTVSVYDIETEEWYTQDTSGQPPGATTQGCTVVASAADYSSHSIYWYGGFDGIDLTKPFSDDVYILSVPSFMWMRVKPGTTSHARAGHRCVKPYPDQMLVIGGYTPSVGNTASCLEGSIIQSFNLSSLEWVPSYNPSQWSNYSVPSMITAVIGGSGVGGAQMVAPTTWNNKSLAAVFATPYDKSKLKTWSTYALGNTSSSNNTRPSEPGDTGNNGNNSSGVPSWLAPVLGVVLGLVLLSAVVVCILLWRRRRLLKSQNGGSVAGTSDANRHRILSWVRGADTKDTTVTSETSPSEAGDNKDALIMAEAADTQVHEMPDNQIQELSGTGMAFMPTRGAVRPPLSKTSHGTGDSQISEKSADNIHTPPQPVSPLFNDRTPRPDSPSLGSEPQSRIVSGVSSTGDLSQISDTGSISERLSQVSGRPRGPQRISSDGLTGLVSPVSPPTPRAQRESRDYTSVRRQPTNSADGKRQSQFEEILDEN